MAATNGPSQALKELRKLVSEAANSAEGAAMGLRIELAAVIHRQLKRRGWSQRRLAAETGMPESTISELIHGDVNWTAETAGRVLFAFGVRCRIAEFDAEPEACDTETTAREIAVIDTGRSTDGEIAAWFTIVETQSAVRIEGRTINFRGGRPIENSAGVGRYRTHYVPARRPGRDAFVRSGVPGDFDIIRGGETVHER